MLLSCQSCSRWENAITLAVSLCPRAGGFSYRSVHNRRHIFNVLWCVPAYAPLSLPRACACCITAVDVARRYELHALAARQRRQLTPRLLVTGWTLLLLAQLAMLSACMHGRPRRRRYHRRRRRRRVCTLASLIFQLSPVMARLRHRCAAKCRERCESRGEDSHPFEGVRTLPLFAFVSIAALAAAAAAAAITTCATCAIVYHWARHR